MEIDLIESGSRAWDVELVNDLFWLADAQHILGIPLAQNVMDDFAAWHFNKNV